MAKNLWLSRFDPNGIYIARREINRGEHVIPAGGIVPNEDFTVRRLRQMYDMRLILFANTDHGFTVTDTLPLVNVDEPDTVQEPQAVEPIQIDEPDTVQEPDIVEGLTPANDLDSYVLPVGLPGLPPVAAVDRDALLEQAMLLNIKVDGRWSDKRLSDEIEKAGNP